MPERQHSSHNKRPIAAVLSGAGAAALVAGIALFLLHA